MPWKHPQNYDILVQLLLRYNIVISVLLFCFETKLIGTLVKYSAIQS